ncbi:MAG: hypothetical protein AAF363_08400 [Bacteroidota bacterium]
MIKRIIKLSLFLLLISKNIFGQNRVRVNIPTSDVEAEYVWRTIQDIDFFEEYDYQVNLPEGDFIESLKNKVRETKTSDKDYEYLKVYMRDSVYNKLDYQKGYEKVSEQLSLINKMINDIDAQRLDWDFKKFEVYKVNLTLYGPGGSYNAEEGSILIFTTPDGKFKQYPNPANTIIHEIVHIGIEESIVVNYDVPHPLKERIVDSFVYLNFKEYLPTYRIQNMGDQSIDRYLKTKSDLIDLHKYVVEILE